MEKKKPKVTIKSIAEYCKVSVGTVSSVLQNQYKNRRITMPTVKKIRNAAKELGYIPDIYARRMRIGSSGKTPLVLSLMTTYEAPLNLTNSYLYALRDAVKNNDAINSRFDVSISIELFPVGNLSSMTSLISGNCCNAAIITNTMAEDDKFLEENPLPFPCVLIDRKIAGYSSVMSSEHLGAKAAKILKTANRKNPAILCGTPLTQSTKQRLESFKKEFGADTKIISAAGLSEGAAYIAMKQFFTFGGKIDSLYTLSDSLAMGAYLAINDMNMKIPTDISVISVGDRAYSEYFNPPLTVLGTNYQEVAAFASSMLISMTLSNLIKPNILNVGDRTIIRKSI